MGISFDLLSWMLLLLLPLPLVAAVW